MQGQMQHQPDAALAGVIGSCRAELSQLYGVVQQEQKRKLQRWWVHVHTRVHTCAA
jgi:hypothetical protein